MDDTSTESSGHTAAVEHLLTSAGLTVADSEFERFVRVYPLLRAQADGMYAAEFAAEDLSLGYDPAFGFN